MTNETVGTVSGLAISQAAATAATVPGVVGAPAALVAEEFVSVMCPVHLFSRHQCSFRCAWQRKELKRLGNDYRQFWFDRRRGVKPMSLFQYQLRYRGTRVSER